MAREALALLDPQPNLDYLDATTGGGGHSCLILNGNAPDGRLLAIDADADAIERARQQLSRFGQRAVLAHANFADAPAVARESGFDRFDGVLADLGLSSDQLADPNRGFAFASDGPLDMRFDLRQERTAADYVNDMREKDLADLIYRYGDERDSRRIARAICQARAKNPITRTGDLAAVVSGARRRRRRGIHPATRTFQALRIAVNRELENLERFLEGILGIGARGARIVVISFHSAEDRLVKLAFRSGQTEGRLTVRTPKPLRPQTDELAANRRARSARLRCAVLN